jgi:hypothetical protein
MTDIHYEQQIFTDPPSLIFWIRTFFKQKRVMGVKSKSSAFCNSLKTPNFQGFSDKVTDMTPGITHGTIDTIVDESRLLIGIPASCPNYIGGPVVDCLGLLCGVLLENRGSTMETSDGKSETTIGEQPTARILSYTVVSTWLEKGKLKIP